jgi:amicyanin
MSRRPVRRQQRADLRILFATLLVAVTGFVFLPGTPARAATGQYVTMSGYAFHPASLTITAGSTVTWTNEDTAPHDVKVTSGPSTAHSPMLSKGSTWSFTFTAPGAYTYVCTVHPGMAAQLAVRPAPATAAPRHPAAPVPTTRTHHTTAAVNNPAHTATTTPVAATPATRQAQDLARQPATTAPSTVAATAQAADSARPLQPLLVLAGLVAGAAVVCLLLVGSRAARAS